MTATISLASVNFCGSAPVGPINLASIRFDGGGSPAPAGGDFNNDFGADFSVYEESPENEE